MRALLHEQLGHGPVHFALLNFMGEMKTIDHLVGARFHHGEGDGFDEAATAHGAVHAAGFGVQIIPVIGFDAYAPGGAAEGPESVTVKAIDIDFASKAVEADGFVTGRSNIHSPSVNAQPYACDKPYRPEKSQY
ncbi:hypothetical protein D3C85_1218180 [compost metagenome]